MWCVIGRWNGYNRTVCIASFYWVHFFDPHLPLTPPKKFEAQYDDPYLAEIAFVDEQIGRLMGELRRMKLDKHTLVVLTADHGEGRGQHREDTHA